MSSKNVIVVLLMVLGASRGAWACSGYFDNQVFAPGDATMLAMPMGKFGFELERAGLVSAMVKDARWSDSRERVKRELDELRLAMKLRDGGDTDLMQAYVALRLVMLNDQQANRSNGQYVVPVGLPAEFELYVKGAIAYRQDRFDAARLNWEKVLKLPENQRKFRSVWAAYMLGRMCMKEEAGRDLNRAMAWFDRVAEMVKAGFADGEGLLRESMGWQAQACFERKDFARAMRMYVELKDEPSLAWVAGKAFELNEEKMALLAKDDVAVRVMNARALAGFSSDLPTMASTNVRRWILVVDQVVMGKMDFADRVAWLAYRDGQIELARRWLMRVKKPTAVARWLEAKMLLYDGKKDQAAKVLAGLIGDEEIKAWSVDYFYSQSNPAEKLAGELGALKMSKGEYASALQLLVEQGFTYEAAYVARRVLSVEELQRLVEQRWPVGDGTAGADWVRNVLAQRLFRAKRLEEGLKYYSASNLSTALAVARCLARGNDRALSRDERGRNLARAARLIWANEDELLGPSYEPGQKYLIPGRSWMTLNDIVKDLTPNRIASRGVDEKERVSHNVPGDEMQLKGRYLAANLAWEAGQLLADESDEKSEILWSAGSWLAPRDAAAADRFYKALVRDCGTTALGRMARERRWF